ncbi:cellulase family glycosylhydrolase [Paenibacillus roseipurpureus]|uniref:Cellulase family glycosylhydrolase n=1 Tax=Paenibacillus roseopurpureus TaxID=2918901 RepID=A0AA96RM37_9BACL|nr:cellulase family glycosylhydrolase [Paenibacillus sp. MBLB1832]WNR46054.1 cellulase family glycosylhydrolase [Paenibacillus sp. MBLB1832]
MTQSIYGKRLSVSNLTLVLSLLFVLISLFFFATTTHAQSTARDRVNIQNGNVVTDDGKPLRGGRFWITPGAITQMQAEPTQFREYFRSLSRDYHLNVVRICIYDQYQTLDPASVSSTVDTVVNWAEEDGIYAIVNWHTGFENYTTQINLTQADRFWAFYAPRYKDRTHVIYEGSNETVTNAASQEHMYNYIRNLAPNTHLIMWSVPNTSQYYGGDTTRPVIDLTTIQNTTGINYSNASIGYHTYSSTSEDTTAKSWRDAGYPIICTELLSDSGTRTPVNYVNMMPLIKSKETLGISWMNWMTFNYRIPVVDQGMNFTADFITNLGTYGITFWPENFKSLVVNGGFEKDALNSQTITGWTTSSATPNADYVDKYAHDGNNRLTHYYASAFNIYTFQTITGLSDGTYKLTVWVRRGGTFTRSMIVAKKFGGTDLSVTTPDNSSWTQVTIDNIVIANGYGKIEVGAYTDANAGAWIGIDQIDLIRTN